MKMTNPRYTAVWVREMKAAHSRAREDMASWNRKKRKNRRPAGR
jgi:hypothetical protein